MKFPSTPYLIKKVPLRFTGPATAVPITISQTAPKTPLGTEITLFLNEDCLEFANEYRAREIIEKYCSFMPTEIYLTKANAEPEYETIDPADKLDTDTVIEHCCGRSKNRRKRK